MNIRNSPKTWAYSTLASFYRWLFLALDKQVEALEKAADGAFKSFANADQAALSSRVEDLHNARVIANDEFWRRRDDLMVRSNAIKRQLNAINEEHSAYLDNVNIQLEALKELQQ